MKDKLVYYFNNKEVNRKEFHDNLKKVSTKEEHISTFISMSIYDDKKYKSYIRLLLRGTHLIICGSNGGVFRIKREKGVNRC